MKRHNDIPFVCRYTTPRAGDAAAGLLEASGFRLYRAYGHKDSAKLPYEAANSSARFMRRQGRETRILVGRVEDGERVAAVFTR